MRSLTQKVIILMSTPERSANAGCSRKSRRSESSIFFIVSAVLWLMAFCCSENPTGITNCRMSIYVSGEPRFASANLAMIVY